jgi:hypothetical protein
MIACVITIPVLKTPAPAQRKKNRIRFCCLMTILVVVKTPAAVAVY